MCPFVTTTPETSTGQMIRRGAIGPCWWQTRTISGAVTSAVAAVIESKAAVQAI